MGSNTKADAISEVDMVVSQLTTNILKIKRKEKNNDDDEDESEYKKQSFDGVCFNFSKKGHRIEICSQRLLGLVIQKPYAILPTMT